MALVLEQIFNGKMIKTYEQGAHIPLQWTHRIPATIEGKAVQHVDVRCCYGFYHE